MLLAVVSPIATAACAVLMLNNTAAVPTTAFSELLLLCFLCALVSSETATQDCVAWFHTTRKILFIYKPFKKKELLSHQNVKVVC